MRFFLPAILLALLAPTAYAQDKDKDPPKKAPVPFDTAHDKPLDAKEEVVKEADDHIQLRVEFNGIKGDRVPAYLYVPKVKGKPVKNVPAVLLQYGMGGNKTSDYIVQIGKFTAAKGYVVLTIDSIGCGERRKKGEKGVGLPPFDSMWHYCGDYSRAIDYLCTRPEVDKDRLCYVGTSWGAISGITFTAYEPRIKAIISVVGGGNFIGLYSTKKAIELAEKGNKIADPVCHVARIAPRPIIFINATKDQVIFKSWAESLHKAAGPGAKVVWVEGDHTLNGVDRTEVLKSVTEFMEKEVAGKKK